MVQTNQTPIQTEDDLNQIAIVSVSISEKEFAANACECDDCDIGD